MMNPTINFLLSVILFFLITQGWSQDVIHPENLLPSAEMLGDFRMEQEIEKYSGDELFSLINGGADLFLEYGFVSVVKADYKNPEGTLDIEIFEMTDPPAAFGIYTMMQMEDEVPDNLGDAGQILGDYALFAKDRFVIKIMANLPDQQAGETLKRISSGIAAGIGTSSFKPLMVLQLVPVTNYDYPELKYFRGSIGLNNIYPLSQNNIYNFRNGVAGIYMNFKVIILECANPEQALLQYSSIANMISTTAKYSEFLLKGMNFSANDPLNNKLAVSVYENFVFLIIHSGNINIEPIRKEIILNIDLITM